jgi:hypothetical protein
MVRFDKGEIEQWIDSLTRRGFPENEAAAWIALRVCDSPEEAADWLGWDVGNVMVHRRGGCDRFQNAINITMLMFGPPSAVEDPEGDLLQEMQLALDPGVDHQVEIAQASVSESTRPRRDQ